MQKILANSGNKSSVVERSGEGGEGLRPEGHNSENACEGSCEPSSRPESEIVSEWLTISFVFVDMW